MTKNKPSIKLLPIFFVLATCLTNSIAQNFSTINSDSVKALLRPSTPHLNTILLEIGKTNKTELIAPITNFLQLNSKLNAQIKWSAYLALARLGDPRALDYVVQRVQKIDVNDDVVYELFPGLVYTRQKLAINYLIQVIQRDDKNCQSADPENSGSINCAYRVLEFLAPVIKDFPIKADASGDLNVRDYESALKLARTWFSKHPDYNIILD